MKPSQRNFSQRTWLGAVMVMMVAACGGGGSGGGDDEHNAPRIDSAGRLVIAENASRSIRVHDLDSNTVEAVHALDHPVAALYSSPGGRYAVAVQRTEDQVQFVDGGVWQEDHVDHMHDYKTASRLLAWKFQGPRPTHYDVQAGVQAAFFMDGNSMAMPPQNAAVHLVTDASIAAGNTDASLLLSEPLHGLAEPMGNKLLVAHRADDARDTLPTHLDLYQRTGNAYKRDSRLSTRCDGMHGSASSGSYTVTGCVDGVLLVRHTSDTAVSEQKVHTELRIGTLAGHARQPGQFIGIATEGVAPASVTTRFYAIDGEMARATDLVPQGWTTGNVRRAHVFDRSGTRFHILDDRGSLIVMQRQGGTWVTLARALSVIPNMPSVAPFPAMVANGARDEIYITDPKAKQVLVVDSLTGTVKTRRNLGYEPVAVTWTGVRAR